VIRRRRRDHRSAPNGPVHESCDRRDRFGSGERSAGNPDCLIETALGREQLPDPFKYPRMRQVGDRHGTKPRP